MEPFCIQHGRLYGNIAGADVDRTVFLYPRQMVLPNFHGTLQTKGRSSRQSAFWHYISCFFVSRFGKTAEPWNPCETLSATTVHKNEL